MKNYYNFAKAFAFLCTTAFTGLFNAQTYCSPTYPNGCSSWRITQVSIPQASFNNTFSSGTCTTGRDRTSVSMNLNTNMSYNVSITTMGWMSCGLAIDLNKDGDFDDSGENLYMPAYIGNSSPETYTGSFTVPVSTAPGSYRMRIWTREANALPGTSACGSYAYGTWTDYTANVLGPLATSEVTKATAKIYPNPVSDVLNIEEKNNIESVEIYDAGGKLLKNISQKGKNASVKLSDLIPGVYTAKIKNDKESQTIKFIKK